MNLVQRPAEPLQRRCFPSRGWLLSFALIYVKPYYNFVNLFQNDEFR